MSYNHITSFAYDSRTVVFITSLQVKLLLIVTVDVASTTSGLTAVSIGYLQEVVHMLQESNRAALIR